MDISKASLADVNALHLIGRETFLETFAKHNTASDMEMFLKETYATEKVAAELNDPESFFYIVRDGEVVIGYLKLNIGSAQSELKEEAGLEIARIYVLSKYHGLKAGQQLYEKAVEVALRLRKSYIWLGVWEENARAIRFYEKNGFLAFDKHDFILGTDVQTDIMMKKELPSVSYRLVTESDMPSLAALRSEGWGTVDYWIPRVRAYWTGESNPQKALGPRVMYVASVHKEIVGFIAGHLTERFDCQGELEWINVGHAYRGSGMAEALLKLLAAWFVERYATYVCVNCASDNIPARRFYIRNGAEDLSEHWLVWKDISTILR